MKPRHGTLAVLAAGWFLGMALVAAGYAGFALIGGSGSMGLQIAALLIVAVGIGSLPIYALVGVPTVALLRRTSLARGSGALVLLAIGVACGLLMRTLETASPMLAANWLCAPAFGFGTAVAWLKVRDD